MLLQSYVRGKGSEITKPFRGTHESGYVIGKRDQVTISAPPWLIVEISSPGQKGQVFSDERIVRYGKK